MIDITTLASNTAGGHSAAGLGPAQEKWEAKSVAMTEEYVLVVDDDPGIHAMLDVILRPLDIDLEGASDGVEALDRVAARRPSLVILDLMLPNLDGFEVLERLGQLPETADIPVLVYSASGTQSDMLIFSWPEQVVSVLSKTASITEVRSSVQSVLSGR